MCHSFVLGQSFNIYCIDSLHIRCQISKISAVLGRGEQLKKRSCELCEVKDNDSHQVNNTMGYQIMYNRNLFIYYKFPSLSVFTSQWM